MMKKKKLFALIFVILILLLNPMRTYRYIATNIEDIYDPNMFNFKFKKEDLNKSTIFLNGETHNSSGTDILKFNLIKYFNEAADVKYILIEGPVTYSEAINEFIETGDLSVIKQHPDFILENNMSIEFLKNIYEFNKSLSPKEKIKFIGIDVESDIPRLYEYICSLIPKEDSPKDIGLKISLLKNLPEIDNNFKHGLTVNEEGTGHVSPKKEALDVLYDIQEDVLRNEKKYKEYLKDNYFKFSYSIDSLLAGVSFFADDNFFDENIANKEFRDKNFYNNIVKIHNEFDNEKFLVQLGSAHIYKRSFYFNDEHYEPVGYLLNNEETSPFKDKVLSFESIYINCGNYDAYKDRQGTVNTKLSIEFTDAIHSNYSMINLNKFRSPFKYKSIDLTPDDTKKIVDENTNKYFDYIFIYKDLPAPSRALIK